MDYNYIFYKITQEYEQNKPTENGKGCWKMKKNGRRSLKISQHQEEMLAMIVYAYAREKDSYAAKHIYI